MIRQRTALQVMLYGLGLAVPTCMIRLVTHRWPSLGMVWEWAVWTFGATVVLLLLITAATLAQWSIPSIRQRIKDEATRRHQRPI